MREDERHRCGNFPHGGENPGHEPAQAVGPGQVGKPSGGKALDYTGSHAGNRSSGDTAQTCTVKNQQDHENASQGNTAESHTGKGQDHHPQGDSERGHIAAVVHSGGFGFAIACQAQQQISSPAQEVSTASAQEGFRYIQGSGVAQGAV